MSFRIGQNVAALCGISATQKLVLFQLASYAKDSTCECWPSQSTLADYCSLTRTAVNQAIQGLIAKGLVTIEGWHGRARKYKLHVPATVRSIPDDSSASTSYAPHVKEINTNVLTTLTPHVKKVNTNMLTTVTQTYKGNKEGEHIISPSLESLIGPIPTNPAERRAWAVNLVRHCYPVWQAWKPIVSSMTASLPALEAKEIEAVCEDTWEYLAAKDSSARLPTLEAIAM